MNTGSSPSQPATQENMVSDSGRIWHRLTHPHRSIQEPERLRRARLLSSLLLVLITGGIVAVILGLLVEELAPNVPTTLIAVTFLAIAYAISRTEHYQIAAALSMITIWVSVLFASVIHYHDPEILYFLILGTLLSSQFLSWRTTILISAASVTTILLVPAVNPLFPISHIVSSAFLVGLTGTLATVASSAQRQDMRHIERQSRELSAHITELTGSREALQRNETRLANILENAAEAIIAVAETQEIILFNHGAEKIFGYQAGEILGQPLGRLLPQRFAETHRRQVEEFGAGDQTSRPMRERREVYGLRKDGTEFPARVGISTHVESGQTIFTAILTDVTDLKAAEDQIHKNAARSRALAEIAQMIVEAGLDNQAILDGIARRVSAVAGDACMVTLLSDDGQQLRLASLFHAEPQAIDLIREVVESSCPHVGIGLHKHVIETGQPILIDEVPQDEIRAAIPPDYWPHLERFGISSLLIVPLRAQDCVVGTLGVSRDRAGSAYEAGDREFLQEIADRTALAVTNARLFEGAQRNLRKVQALRKIDIAITGSLDLRISLGTILEQLKSQMRVDASNVLVFNPHTLTLDYAVGRGFRTDALQHTHIRLGEGYAGRAAQERRRIYIPDLRGRATDFLRSPAFLVEGFVSYCAEPLIAKGQVKGVLEIFHRSELDPGSEWMDFLEAVSGQAAIAIDNNGLFDDLQRSNLELVLAYDATIEGWSRALDLRDKETEGHTQRVTEMTLRLARALGVEDAELVHIRRGALLHDIGKMGIPDSILLKPGPLSEGEWQVMRKHPVYAYEMLASISYLKPALDIPYCHHEKWDGSGYPRGLEAENIPLAARIFAVVDVWDALNSERPYRPAWAPEKIHEYIRQQRGRHFDPQVVDAFFEMM